MKKILPMFVFMLAFIFSFLNQETFAHNFEPHVHTGGHSDAVSLKTYIDSSVTSFGYYNHVNDALYQWSNVNYAAISFAKQEASGAEVKIYVGNITTENWYGEATYYTVTWYGDVKRVGSSDPRDITQIRLNDDAMDKANFTAGEAKHTVNHEVGHALSLGHCDCYAVMEQGSFDRPYLTSTDKDHVSAKW